MLAEGDPQESPSRIGRWRAALRRGAGAVLDFALPPVCASCREPLGEGSGVCAECWSKLALIEKPYCARLGIPFVYDPGPGLLSMEAIANPPSFDRARAAVRYDDIARDIVHALKYSDRLDLAPTMGRWMARAGQELFADADAIVPVPLHWRRQWARRVNQSALLAAEVSRVSGVPARHDMLRRTRATRQQVGLSKSERASNLQGAFRVADDQKAAVKGRRLILVDDVLTSGATAEACTKALLRAGASHVDVLVFARVVTSV